jgi:hypothetical protein
MVGVAMAKAWEGSGGIPLLRAKATSPLEDGVGQCDVSSSSSGHKLPVSVAASLVCAAPSSAADWPCISPYLPDSPNPRIQSGIWVHVRNHIEFPQIGRLLRISDVAL